MQKNLLKTLIFKYRFELIFLTVTAILHIFILSLNQQLAFGDLAPFPESWQQGFTDFFYAWRDISFGIYRHPGNITNLFQSILIFIFRSPLLAQKFYIVFLLPFIAFISAKNLLKTHFGAKDNAFLFIMAFFYTYSPAMLTEFVGGTQYSTMLIFAIFPYLACLSLDVLLEFSKKSALLLTLTLSLLLSIDIHLLVIYAIFLGICCLTILIATFKTSLFKKHFIYMIIIGIVVTAALLSNPIYLINNFFIVNPPAQIDSNVGFANNYITFLNDVKYTYSRSSLLNTIRLGNNLSDFNYTNFSVWTTPFLLLALFTLIYSLFTYKKSDTKRKVFIFGYVFTTLFIYFTFLRYTYPIFIKLPLLFIFRNPAKITLLNTMFFYVCFYNALLRVSEKKSKLVKFILYSSILIYSWPAFLLDRGLSYTRSEFTIPSDYYLIKNTLKEDAKVEDFRTIWIPSTYEATSIKLTWIDRSRIEDQLGFSEFATDNYGSYIVKAISEAIVNNDKELFDKLTFAANVNYIVLTKDDKDNIGIKNFYSTTSISSGYKKLDELLKEKKVIFENNTYKIYKLPNTPSPIYTINEVSELNYKINNSVPVISNYYKYYTNLLSYTDKSKGDFLVAKMASDDLSNHVLEWDHTWSWPEPKINPLNPFFPIVMLKEKVGFDLRNDPIEKIERASWIISKRSEEIYRFGLKGITLDKSINNIKFYEQYIYNYYKSNALSTDLTRDTAVKTYVYLNKSKKHIGFKGDILDEVITTLKKRIDESYETLCITNCLKVKSDTQDNFFIAGKENKIIPLIKGENSITTDTNNLVLFASTAPSNVNPILYELKNIEPNKKYVLDFDYNTMGDIYKVKLFSQYKNKNGDIYEYETHFEYILTSEFNNSKHFRIFFQPKYRKDPVTILKFEFEGEFRNQSINISDLKVSQVSTNGTLLVKTPNNINNTPSKPETIEYEKISPSEYKIKTDKLKTKNHYLIFADNFSPDWKLYTDNGVNIAIDKHTIANTYANIWQIDSETIKDSEFIYLRFEPQKYLTYSYEFTAGFIILLAFLIFKKSKIK